MDVPFFKAPLKAATAALAISIASLATAEPVTVPSALSVDAAIERIVAAVEKSGATIFSQVDFRKCSQVVGLDLRPTRLVMFGNPKIGATALQSGQTMGLYLPLRILAYENAQGETWLKYPNPQDAALEHGIKADHPAVLKMHAVLKNLTSLATSE